jgi:hypothetical protein
MRDLGHLLTFGSAISIVVLTQVLAPHKGNVLMLGGVPLPDTLTDTCELVCPAKETQNGSAAKAHNATDRKTFN